MAVNISAMAAARSTTGATTSPTTTVQQEAKHTGNKLPRQDDIDPTRPPVASLTELVASIGQNSQNKPQQQQAISQQQVRIDPARSQKPSQCNAPILRGILDSNMTIQHNSTRGGHIVETGHLNSNSIAVEKTGTPSNPDQCNKISTLSTSQADHIRLSRPRPTTHPERPTYAQIVLNKNSMNDMHRNSHHEHAIRVEYNTQYPIDYRVTKQNSRKKDKMDQNQAESRQLEKIKQKQEAIRKMFHNAKSKHLLDPRIYRPYCTKPVFIASFATRSKKPTFQCLACNYKTRGKSHFEDHHKTDIHALMLSKWSLKQLQQRFPNHVLQIQCPESNTVIPDHDFYTTRPERPTKRPSPEEQKKNLQKIQATPLEKTSLPDEDLDTLPIQWHPKQPMPGTTIEELNLEYTHNAAMAGIKKLTPSQYRKMLTDLVSNMFNAGKTYKLKINISESFLDTNHWSMFKYERLMKRTNLRQYLIQQASNGNYNVVKKDKSQDQEMEKIAGAARTVYDIILNCKFVPIQYICILAVLMDKGEHPNFICSSMRTITGHYIDLFLESGIFTIIKDKITQEVPTSSNQTCSIEEQFSRIVMEDQTIHIAQDVDPSLNNATRQNQPSTTPTINTASEVDPIYLFNQ